MTRNNKGFSLVELIVAMAIFAIVGLALVSFIMSSTNNFNKSNNEINLQYEQQLVVNQIRDIILESGEGIYFDGTNSMLSVYGSKKQNAGVTKYPVSFVSYDDTKKELYLSTKDFTDKTSISLANAGTKSVFAEGIEEFYVDLSEVEDEKVTFKLKFVYNELSQEVTETVALRNRLMVSNNADAIWADVPGEVESFVESVSISRGVKKFTTGETDTIGIYGSGVEVHYTADVYANAYSTRDYLVSWSISGVAGPEATPPTGISITSNNNEVAVRIESSILVDHPNATFYLYATSIDYPDKNTHIKIDVTDNGVYAETLNLEPGEVVYNDQEGNPVYGSTEEPGNGYNAYVIVPKLRYSDGTTTSEYNYFDWDVTVTPEDPEVPEEEVDESIVVVEQPYFNFDEDTGRLVIYAKANGKTITVKATAKERAYDGTLIEDTIPFNPTNIPEYDPGTTLRIGVEEEMSRGGFLPVSLEMLNAPDDSEYTYRILVEGHYDSESTQWNSVNNSEMENISFTEAEEYDSKNVKLSMELKDSNRINLTCSKKLNWSYPFKVIISAVATDQDGKEFVAETATVLIPAVKVNVIPTVEVPKELDTFMVYDDKVLRYEDWYFKENGQTSQKLDDCTTRRWFRVDFDYLEVDESDWANYTVSDSYLFMNQVGIPLNQRVVSYPNFKFNSSELLAGLRINLNNWERLANRPIYMNITVNVRDGQGNMQASEAQEYIIVYSKYPSKK